MLSHQKAGIYPVKDECMGLGKIPALFSVEFLNDVKGLMVPGATYVSHCTPLQSDGIAHNLIQAGFEFPRTRSGNITKKISDGWTTLLAAKKPI